MKINHDLESASGMMTCTSDLAAAITLITIIMLKTLYKQVEYQ